ncbi:metallo-beta-lactamase domain protein (macronuclear) [Tetrahymena thermophila SB210]|uniref:ribonuclease Z n=1 Tax=Tetrahymena thermophila (strain SB210) TaxID=312017 RepID=Q22B11_TETTS|nr:metallo-beta-lactamase domain protein [Tetrahymena thermophila SB210]EAR82497.1 metallo-beta-lactamase domain protein [Tetrahymena thermophila SB210]|eukprot:XP_001030160.1 metallo-beta-lactamase domain protein [Tetrahymena thermophila SB210]
MKIPIQIIQNYLTQQKACIMLTVEDAKTQRYHFNIPDATQRYQKEHYLNFVKGSRFFLTELSPENINGLLGLMCTMSAQDRSEDTCLYGAGITQFLESTRYLMQLNMNLQSCYDFQTKQTLLGFQNGQDLVKHFVSDSSYCPQKQYKFNKFIQENNLKANDSARYINDQNEYKDEFVTIQPLIMQNQQGKMNISYIITTKQIAGKVIKEKLNEFNVPPKLTGQLLKDGQITLPDGKVVNVKDVKEEDIDPQIIIISDISDYSILNQLISQEKIKQLIGKNISALVTIAQPDIIENDLYQNNFLNSLKPVQHLIVNSEYKYHLEQQEVEVLEKTHNERVHHVNELNKYFPLHFPNLQIENLTSRFKSGETSKYFQGKQNEFLGTPLKELIIYPFNKPYSLLNQTKQKVSKKKEVSDDFIKNFEKLTLEQEQTNLNEQNQQSNSKIVFLGTGSMIPLPSRTVSAILIENNKNNILLDCGEGTYSQILYQYGVEKSKQIIKDTKFIFISHIHLDHCLGLFYFLFKRDQIIQEQSKEYNNQNDVYILLSSNLLPLVRSFDKYSYRFSKNNKFIITNDYNIEEQKLQELINHANNSEDFDDNDQLIGDTLSLSPYEHPKEQQILRNYFSNSSQYLKEFKEKMKDFIQINDLQVCEVIHCGQSYGISLNLIWGERNFKISYSGDTRPCSKFEEISKNSDVFIHECTFSDDLQKNAEENNHATLSEAINSCKNSSSKMLVLTHFSQRYSQIEVEQFKGDKDFLKNHTIVANDHFQAPFYEYTFDSYLPQITQQAQKIFSKEEQN